MCLPATVRTIPLMDKILMFVACITFYFKRLFLTKFDMPSVSELRLIALFVSLEFLFLVILYLYAMSAGRRAVGKECPNDLFCFVGSWPRAPVRQACSLPSLKWIFTQSWDECFHYSQWCAIFIWPIISQNLLSCFLVLSLFIAGFSSSLSTKCNYEKLLFRKVCSISSALKTLNMLSSTHRSHARIAED